MNTFIENLLEYNFSITFKHMARNQIWCIIAADKSREIFVGKALTRRIAFERASAKFEEAHYFSELEYLSGN